MVHRPKPLTVAAVAGALLLVVLAADVSLNRAVALDVRQEEGWVTLARAGEVPHEIHGPGGRVAVAGNETLLFRLRVDNGYPWDYEERYEVYARGALVAEGVLEADAMGEGVEQFTVDPSQLPGAGGPRPVPEETEFLFLEVRVGEHVLFADVALPGKGATA